MISPPKNIAWTDQAKADLRAIDQPTALRILHALARYRRILRWLHLMKYTAKRQDIGPFETSQRRMSGCRLGRLVSMARSIYILSHVRR